MAAGRPEGRREREEGGEIARCDATVGGSHSRDRACYCLASSSESDGINVERNVEPTLNVLHQESPL
jgi:hypothetical protein